MKKYTKLHLGPNVHTDKSLNTTKSSIMKHFSYLGRADKIGLVEKMVWSINWEYFSHSQEQQISPLTVSAEVIVILQGSLLYSNAKEDIKVA